MKKIIALILSLMITLSVAACSDKTDKTAESSKSDAADIADNAVISDGEIESDAEIGVETPDEEKTEDKKDEPSKEENKPAQTPSQSNPEGSKPAEPETAPQPESSAKTIGTKLLADFNSKAASYADAKSLAEAISKNSSIEFMPVVENVSAGLLTGFGNAQISGFKDGAKFAPMIGTIPFVGYIFVLEDGASAASFISQLRANANPNWNVCSTADETITGSVGNKVFFVMSPKNFEE